MRSSGGSAGCSGCHGASLGGRRRGLGGVWRLDGGCWRAHDLTYAIPMACRIVYSDQNLKWLAVFLKGRYSRLPT